MGYADRFKKRIVQPAPGTVHIDQMSKRQLARLVNEYGQRLTQVEDYNRKMVRILVATIETPEAMKRVGRRLLIETAAVTVVKAGTELHIDDHGLKAEAVEVWVTEPGVVEAPAKILIPADTH